MRKKIISGILSGGEVLRILLYDVLMYSFLCGISYKQSNIMNLVVLSIDKIIWNCLYSNNLQVASKFVTFTFLFNIFSLKLYPKIDVKKEDLEYCPIKKEESPDRDVGAQYLDDSMGEICDDSCFMNSNSLFFCWCVGIISPLTDSYSISFIFDNVAMVDIKQEDMEESYAQVSNQLICIFFSSTQGLDM